jgi:hypothetical protein
VSFLCVYLLYTMAAWRNCALKESVKDGKFFGSVGDLGVHLTQTPHGTKVAPVKDQLHRSLGPE